MLSLSRFTLGKQFLSASSCIIIVIYIVKQAIYFLLWRSYPGIAFAYERVACMAINTVAESLGYITSLLRLFCQLKVPPPVCLVCLVATKAGGKTCRAASPILPPVWAGVNAHAESGGKFLLAFQQCQKQESQFLSSFGHPQLISLQFA